MKKIVILFIIASLFNACDKNKSKDCRSEIIKKLKSEFENKTPDYLGAYSVFKKELKDFITTIDTNQLLNTEDNTYSKPYYLHRNWDLEHIKEDECEDALFLVFDAENNMFRIQINNCSIYKEEGEDTQISESSILFEYEIEEDCTYTFKRINGAG